MPLFEQVLKNNPEKVKLVFKNFPLRNHQYAAKAAMGALAADVQGKFWEFHDRLFADFNHINDQKIKDIARELGYKTAEFEKQMADPGILSRIRQDVQDGTAAGVRGTPTVFINGKQLRSRTLKGFQDLIDKELEKIEKTPN
ncbi:MAG: thioredoxin domain-containing protein [Desulfobacterales bacterium]|uniref:Thioredoxin domain-containing protein n=1 Tax=Candidatus Desulfatibia vada TaxID=2841696 RepID=A0A8J6P3H4_9BACT|nr:thioredoxin domain-containing protein [Candidatus Desulfatibia vada]